MGPSRFLTHNRLRLATMRPVVLRRLLQRLLFVPEPASPRSVSSSCKQSAVRLDFSMKPHLPGCFAHSFSPGFFRLSTDILVIVALQKPSSQRASTLAGCAAAVLSGLLPSTLCDLRSPSCRDASSPAWSGLMIQWPRSQSDPRACVSTHSSSAQAQILAMLLFLSCQRGLGTS